MKKAVLFDCDGVLVNSEEMSLDLELAHYAKHGLHFNKQEYAKRKAGLVHEDSVKFIDEEYRKVNGIEPPLDLHDEIPDIYEHVENTLLSAIDGVREMLADLTAKGTPIAVASNSPSIPLVRRLKKVDLYQYFNGHVYSADMVAKAKPAPDLYQFAARKLGYKPEDCLVVEDSVPGAKAGVAAGAFVIGYSGGSHKAPEHMGAMLDAGAREVVAHMPGVHARLARHLGFDGVIKAPKGPGL